MTLLEERLAELRKELADCPDCDCPDLCMAAINDLMWYSGHVLEGSPGGLTKAEADAIMEVLTIWAEREDR